MGWKKGWIEDRRSGKNPTPQLVDYRVLAIPDFTTLSHDANYSKTTIRNSSIANMMAQLLHVPVEDIVAGQITFCSQEPLKPGMHMEFLLLLPNYNTKLKFLVETTKVDFQAEMKEMVFSAGMAILAINKSDMELLTRIIENKKKV
jgi:hypothetical protein